MAQLLTLVVSNRHAQVVPAPPRLARLLGCINANLPVHLASDFASFHIDLVFDERVHRSVHPDPAELPGTGYTQIAVLRFELVGGLADGPTQQLFAF
ncbi:hypothetical protein D3C76_1185600 [compost metagenome]